MTDIPRFSDEDEGSPAGALFRSMRTDAPDPSRRAAVLSAALAAGAATAAVSTAAAAATGSAATTAAGSAATTAAGSAATTAGAAAAVPLATASAAKIIGAFLLGGALTAATLTTSSYLTGPSASSGRAAQPVVAAAVDPPPTHEVRPNGPSAAAAELASAEPPVPDVVKEVDPSTATSADGARPGSAPSATGKEPSGRAAEPLVALPPAAVVATETAAPTPPPPSLADEVKLLDESRQALGRGDGPGALRSLDLFQQTFPRARLGTEALVLRIEALVASGRRGDAQALGQTFLDAHPESALAPRVRRAIGEKKNVLTIP
jgi:hypothetical protein